MDSTMYAVNKLYILIIYRLFRLKSIYSIEKRWNIYNK